MPQLVAMLFLIALLVTSCGRSSQAATAAVAEQPAPVVAVAPVIRTDLVRESTLTGELLPYQEVEVLAKVAGYVQKIYVDAGDSLRQGQLIATLEVPEMADDLTKTEAAINRAQADLKRASQEVARAEKSYEIAQLSYTRLASVSKSRPGLVAQQEVDDALSKGQMAEAQLAAARSALDVIREQIKMNNADHARATTLLQYTRVVAPFDGIVTKRYANNGSMIQAGTSSQTQAMPLIRLSQNAKLRLSVDVPESAAPVVKTGLAVSIRIPSLDQTFDGVVARTSDRISTATRTLHAEIDVSNPQRKLIPGMYAEVSLQMEKHRGVLVAPPGALALRDGKRTALVVNAQQQVENRVVEVGWEMASQVEILSGLRESEAVIVGGASRVRPGQKVVTRQGD